MSSRPPSGSLAALPEILGLLSELFLEPEADVRVRLMDLLGRCPETCPELSGLPAALRKLASVRQSPQEQAAEYVRLFLRGAGGRPVHLYESAHTHDRIMDSECLRSLESIQRDAGLRPRPDLHLPPDHLALELLLLAHAVRSFSGARGGERARWREIARRLLRRHLVPFGRFVRRRLDESSPALFFDAAGEVLVQALQVALPLVEEEAAPRAEWAWGTTP